jgi:hypothetical protein
VNVYVNENDERCARFDNADGLTPVDLPDYLPENFGDSPPTVDKYTVAKQRTHREHGGLLSAITNVLQRSFYW